MAMPWKRAKQIQKAILGEGEFPDPYKGSRTISELTDLFNQCFRVQREISQAAGHHVPMIVENVRGAQKWVGKARWNFGSYYLWGDVPALMPIPSNATKVPSFRFDGNGGSFQTAATNRSDGVKAGEHKWSNSFSDTLKGEGNKTVGMNWSDPTKRGQDFTRIAGMQAGGLKRPSENGRRTDPGKEARFTSRDCGNEGTKNFTPNGEPLGKNAMAKHGSKSNARKQASAEIAKIPHSLAQWIAKTFKVSL